MSWFGKLLGTDEAAGKMIDTLAGGFDKLHYGAQERAEDAAKDVSEARAMLVRWMEATQGQNLSRRVLAFIITGVWLFQFVGSMIGDMIMPWITDPSTSAAFAKSTEAIGGRAESMNGAMMLILGFYFAAPHLSAIIPAAMKKFGGK